MLFIIYFYNVCYDVIYLKLLNLIEIILLRVKFTNKMSNVTINNSQNSNIIR